MALLGRRKTTNEFVIEAKEIWGDHFDYSVTEYVNRKSLVTIICPNCGPIEIVAGNHVSKQPSRKPAGCDRCNRNFAARLLTKSFNDFLISARTVHEGRYEYTESTYVSARVPMRMVCPLHGEFFQSPDSHINKQSGCPKCGNIKKANDSLAERFISVLDRVNKLSNGKVTLDFSSYKGQNFNTKFTCDVHGEFFRKPIAALSTRHPCPECMNELPNNNKLLEPADIKKRILMMDGKFDVLAIKGKGKRASIMIECLTNEGHNPLKPTKLDNLYTRKYACPKCAHESAQEKRTLSIQKAVDTKRKSRASEWKSRASEFHQGKYDYSLSRYSDALSEVIIICPFHGAFSQLANSHLRSGCRKCADENLKGRYTYTYFDRYPEEYERPAILYHVCFQAFGQKLYKVGITVNSIKQRFESASGKGITYSTIVQSELTLYEAFVREQKLLELCSTTVQNSLSDAQCKELRNARIGITELIDNQLSKKLIAQFF